jgi:hypothetical protein
MFLPAPWPFKKILGFGIRTVVYNARKTIPLSIEDEIFAHDAETN